MKLKFRWPVWGGIRWPFFWTGVKCLKCYDQGQYMVMRPGMFVFCDECNAAKADEVKSETTHT